MREANVLRSAWLAVARTSTLFRVNSGMAWLSGGGKPQRLADGSVVVPGGRPVALGFALADGKTVEGQSDLCGWTDVLVTPEMLGCKLPVFTAIETKATTGGRKREGQINFIEQVTKAGGIAGFANTPAVAQSIISNWLRKFDQK